MIIDQAEYQLLRAVNQAQEYFITEQRKPNEIFSYLLDSLLKIAKSSYGFVGRLLYDEQGNPNLKTYALTSTSPNKKQGEFYLSDDSEGIEFRNLDSLVGAVLIKQEVIISNDTVVEVGGEPNELLLHSFLGVPIMAHGKMIGMYAIGNGAVGYSDLLVQFLQPFTSTFSVILYSFLEKEKIEIELKDKQDENMSLIEALSTHQEELEQQNEELRQSQDEVLASRDNFESIFQYAPIPYVETDTFGVFLRLNEKARIFFQMQDTQPKNTVLLSLKVIPDQHKRFSQFLSEVLQSSSPLEEEFYMIPQREKPPVYVHISAVKISYSDVYRHAILRISITELSEIKEYQNKLERAQKHLHALLDATAYSYFLLNPDYTILSFNQVAANAILGAFDQKLEIGQNILPYIDSEKQAVFYSHFASALTGKEVKSIQSTTLLGKKLWFEIQHIPVRDEANQIYAVAFTAVDVTKEYIQKEEIQQLALVTQETDNSVVITDSDGLIEWVNQSFEKLSGYTLQEVKGKKPGDCLQGKDSDPVAIDQMRQAIAKHETVKTELINYHKDGTPYWIEISIQPIVDETGKSSRFFSIQRDVTKRKMQEAAIYQQNQDLLKVNSELDNFVYRVSHDLRAPILSSLGLIEVSETIDDLPTLRNYLGLQKQSLKRLDEFIHDILNYSRNARLDVNPELIDFTEVLKAIDLDTKYIRERRINFLYSVNGDVPFYTDLFRLNVALKNIISNAFKFSDTYKDHPFVKVEVEVTADFANIKVSDNGIGIMKEYLDKVFDMFFRANDVRKGSGLGLYITKETLQKLKGTISVSSETNKGTEFLMQIPNATPIASV